MKMSKHSRTGSGMNDRFPETIRSQRNDVESLMGDVLRDLIQGHLAVPQLDDHLEAIWPENYRPQRPSRAASLAMRLALGSGVSTGLLLIERSPRETLLDLLVAHAGLPTEGFPMSDTVLAQMKSAAVAISDSPLWLHRDTSYHTVSIQLVAERLSRRGNIELLIVELPSLECSTTGEEQRDLANLARTVGYIQRHFRVKVISA